MNIENNSHNLKNYLIGTIAILLVMFIPTLNWIDKKYSIDPLKLDSSDTNSSDQSKSPELLTANSSDLRKQFSSLLTQKSTVRLSQLALKMIPGSMKLNLMNGKTILKIQQKFSFFLAVIST
jgi:hypothetical protein